MGTGGGEGDGGGGGRGVGGWSGCFKRWDGFRSGRRIQWPKYRACGCDVIISLSFLLSSSISLAYHFPFPIVLRGYQGPSSLRWEDSRMAKLMVAEIKAEKLKVTIITSLLQVCDAP